MTRLHALVEETVESKFTPNRNYRKPAWREFYKNAPKPHSTVWPTRHSEIIALIEVLREEYGHANWDGEGSLAVDNISAEHCIRGLFKLNDGLPLPQLWCEPLGRVNAIWETSKTQINIAFCNDRELILVGTDSRQRNRIKRTHDWAAAEDFMCEVMED